MNLSKLSNIDLPPIKFTESESTIKFKNYILSLLESEGKTFDDLNKDILNKMVEIYPAMFELLMVLKNKKISDYISLPYILLKWYSLGGDNINLMEMINPYMDSYLHFSKKFGIFELTPSPGIGANIKVKNPFNIPNSVERYNKEVESEILNLKYIFNNFPSKMELDFMQWLKFMLDIGESFKKDSLLEGRALMSFYFEYHNMRLTGKALYLLPYFKIGPYSLDSWGYTTMINDMERIENAYVYLGCKKSDSIKEGVRDFFRHFDISSIEGLQNITHHFTSIRRLQNIYIQYHLEDYKALCGVFKEKSIEAETLERIKKDVHNILSQIYFTVEEEI